MQPAQKRITGKGREAGQAGPSAKEDLKMVSAPLHGSLASAWRTCLRASVTAMQMLCVNRELKMGAGKTGGRLACMLVLLCACVTFNDQSLMHIWSPTCLLLLFC